MAATAPAATGPTTGPTAGDPDRTRLALVLRRWFATHARDLPWRGPDTTAWQVLVSEFMLQQTPVARVLPVYLEWIDRWPRPESLAAQPVGEAVRAWGRLGYPRRAVRLHGSAVAIVTEHDGEVPAQLEQLRRLPGVGDYTAAAVAAFAFHRRVPVLDTNVRRVLARLLDGQAYERPGAPTVGERQRALHVLPTDGEGAAATAQALMELGATVCSARRPQCGRCPVLEQCTWHSAGQPRWQGPARRGQAYAGTDRQCRGRLLAVLRDHTEPVGLDALDQVWPDEVQRRRALVGLVTDGLVEQRQPGEYALPR